MGAPGPSSLRQALAANVRRERRAQGLSQEGLADLASLHRTFIGFVERAETNISIDNIEKIAAALGLDASSLLERKEAAEPYLTGTPEGLARR